MTVFLILREIRISLDYIKNKTKNEENKTFLSCHHRKFEQLVCQGCQCGAFSS